MKAGEFRD